MGGSQQAGNDGRVTDPPQRKMILWYTPVPLEIGAHTPGNCFETSNDGPASYRAILLGRGARKSTPDWQEQRYPFWNRVLPGVIETISLIHVIAGRARKTLFNAPWR